jgi:hypothetical protein
MRRLRAIAEFVARLSARRKGAVTFLIGLIVGIFSGALTNPDIRSPGQVFNLVFDVGDRPIAWANCAAVAVLGFLALGPSLAVAWTRRRKDEHELAKLFRSSRLVDLANDAALSIDGAVTVARSPNIHEGWRLDGRDVEFEHTDSVWRPPGSQEDRERYWGEMTRAGRTENGTIVMLTTSPTAMTDVPVLRLRARSVRFF